MNGIWAARVTHVKSLSPLYLRAVEGGISVSPFQNWIWQRTNRELPVRHSPCAAPTRKSLYCERFCSCYRRLRCQMQIGLLYSYKSRRPGGGGTKEILSTVMFKKSGLRFPPPSFDLYMASVQPLIFSVSRQSVLSQEPYKEDNCG